MLYQKLTEYIMYKQMLTNTSNIQGLYGIDSKVRKVHKEIITILDDNYFEGKLIVERLQRMFDNINSVLSKEKGLDFFNDKPEKIAEDLYYWLVLNARVKFWLIDKNIKRPEWFNF